MIALKIADVGDFMKKLLLSDVFDHFLLLEGSVTAFNTFQIDGFLQKNYYNTEEQELLGERTLSYWAEVRPFCLSLIKGKRTPLAFRFSLQLSPTNVEKLLAQSGVAIPAEQVRGLILNVVYERRVLTCTTGTSLTVFTLDKKLDHVWEDMVQRFFHQQKIPFEIL
ncbi:MAG: DUF5721 family protein [Lachnospiraceae bacterium]|nr:DUF5721 family protein [Lachnospiraceae bacterium]